MDVLDIYKQDYVDYCELPCNDEYAPSKYEWIAHEVFDLTTYDGELDELFGKKIIEVLRAILERQTFEYIRDKDNYISYILVCQLLDKFKWINWGTSIRGAWFETYHSNYITRPILEEDWAMKHIDGAWKQFIYPEVPFTEENIKTLIEFVSSDDMK